MVGCHGSRSAEVPVKWGFLEQGKTEYLQDLVKTGFDVEAFAHGDHQHIDRDGDPDLGFHDISLVP